MKKLIPIAILCALFSHITFALSVPINKFIDGDKVLQIGQIDLKDTPYGVVITPDLWDLKPGLHGFHMHENPSCADQGKAAGGHFDPAKTGKHLGPYDNRGHLGDLPALYVKESGSAKHPVLAPRLKVSDFIGHSLVIHEGSDNYSDVPAKLGGGGKRAACGIVSEQAKKSNP